MPRIPVWLLYLLVLVAFELVADVCAKEFSIRGKPPFAVAALIAYVLANMAWLVSLRSGASLSRGAVLFSVLSAGGAVFVGAVMYHERILPVQAVGLALGVAAVACLAAG